MADSEIKAQQIPPEARMVLMQPHTPEMLAPVEGYQLLSLFYFQMPFMLRKQQVTSLNKSAQKLGTYLATGILVGLVTNVQIKRVYLNFLRWPIYVKIPIRMGIMSLPFLAFMPFFQEKLGTIHRISQDLTRRKNRLLRTGDVQEYFGVRKSSKAK